MADIKTFVANFNGLRQYAGPATSSSMDSWYSKYVTPNFTGTSGGKISIPFNLGITNQALIAGNGNSNLVLAQKSFTSLFQNILVNQFVGILETVGKGDQASAALAELSAACVPGDLTKLNPIKPKYNSKSADMYDSKGRLIKS